METLKQGWLSPTGEFFECGSFDHIDVAGTLCEPLHLPDYDFKTERRISADDKLLNYGWVYIGISCFFCHEWRIAWRAHLSYEQKKFLEPYFEDGGGLPVNDMSAFRWKEEIE